MVARGRKRGAVSVSVDGYNDVQSCKTRRARKEHRCDACRETIRVGDSYINEFTVYDGNSDTTKRCLRCDAMLDAIQSRMIDADIDPHEEGVDRALNCGHTWNEDFREEPPEEVARLAFLTRDEAQAELKKTGAR